MSEVLTRALFEHLVDNAYDTGNSQRIYDHDAALRSALLVAESRAERLEAALKNIQDETTDETALLIASAALGEEGAR